MRDYYDLGTYSRPVTTSSTEAKVWFDRGLIWRYAFNHEAALTCFRTAAARDPACAMAAWGIAYASGPYYNKRWEDFAHEELEEALGHARRGLDAALVLLVQLFSFLPPFRVLLVWVYAQTGSLLVAILMHASLVVCTLSLAPPAIAGATLVITNLAVTAALWMVVAAITLANRRQLARQSVRSGAH